MKGIAIAAALVVLGYFGLMTANAAVPEPIPIAESTLLGYSDFVGTDKHFDRIGIGKHFDRIGIGKSGIDQVIYARAAIDGSTVLAFAVQEVGAGDGNLTA